MTDADKAHGAGAIRRRLTPFRWGVIAGFLAPVILVASGYGVIRAIDPHPRFNVQVTSVGADVSRHGGAKVVVSGEHGDVLTQICNGPCDDLAVGIHSGAEGVYGVKVLDGAGHCVACDDGRYVTTGLLTRWTVSGAETLINTTSDPGRSSDKLFNEQFAADPRRP